MDCGLGSAAVYHTNAICVSAGSAIYATSGLSEDEVNLERFGAWSVKKRDERYGKCSHSKDR